MRRTRAVAHFAVAVAVGRHAAPRPALHDSNEWRGVARRAALCVPTLISAPSLLLTPNQYLDRDRFYSDSFRVRRVPVRLT